MPARRGWWNEWQSKGRRVDFANPVVERIGKVDVALRVNREACGRIDRRAGCGAAIAREACRARASNSRDDLSSCVHFADAVTQPVADVEVAGCVGLHVPWDESGAGSGAAIAKVIEEGDGDVAGAGHGADDAVGRHFANAVVGAM